MKNYFRFFIIDFIVLCTLNSSATTITLNPYGNQGEEASIWTLSANSNVGPYDHIAMNGWTWNSAPGIERELMNFNWSLIPPNATITCATLSLYGNVGSNQYDWPLSGSNAFYIQRVTSPWSALTVTWNSQPGTDVVHRAALLQSSGQYDDYLNINVLAMVQDMYNNPGTYHGFLFLLQNENYYRRMCFKSAEQPDTSLFPKLTICYTLNGNLPKTSFVSSGTEFCGEGGACVNFFDSTIGNPTSWQWIFYGGVPDSSNKQNPDSVCYYQPGTYPVTLIAGNAYGYDTLTAPSMIILDPLPASPVVTIIGGDTLICSHASHYQWFLNGSPIFGATDSFYIAKNGGTYSVQVGDRIGCSRISDGVVVAGIIETGDSEGIEVKTNLQNNFLTIYSSNVLLNATVRIYSSLGIKIYDDKFSGSELVINRKLPPGIYFLRIQSATHQLVKKVIID